MYTYAFLSSSQPLELPEGIWGSLELIQTESLAALVEPNFPVESLQQADRLLMQAVLSHDRIIQEVFQQTTVLPLRFGTYFISRQGLIDHLKSHQQDYSAKLSQLQGMAEYTLKLTAVPCPIPDSPTADAKGKDYFLAKKQLYQQQADWQQQQQLDLEALIEQVNARYFVQRGETEGQQKLYLLSDQQREPELQQQLSQWQQCSGWQISMSEALPPYHFV